MKRVAISLLAFALLVSIAFTAMGIYEHDVKEFALGCALTFTSTMKLWGVVA